MRLIRNAENRSALWPSILCAGLVGFLFFNRIIGLPIAHLSFDTPFLFGSATKPTNVIVITMDEGSYNNKKVNTNYFYPDFNRATHAEMLKRLSIAPVVVFDVIFAKSFPEDPVFAAAITNHGKVIIAAELEEMSNEFGRSGAFSTNDPVDIFLNLPGCEVAFAENPVHAVRTFPVERDFHRSVPLAAAATYGKPVDPHPKEQRWVRYYGDGNRENLPSISYDNAWELFEKSPASFKETFKGKVVFIGGKTITQFPGEKPDQFETPFTRWSGNKMRGVELLATMFANLTNNEWLTEASTRDQALGILLAAILFGWTFASLRPVPGLIVLFSGAIAVSVFGTVLFWTQRVWFNWALIGWIEIPIAWATSAIVYSRTIEREKETLKKKLDSITLAPMPIPPAPVAPAGPSPANAIASILPVPTTDISIPNYELLKLIGDGSYGQVWLARNKTVKLYRAIKIVFRRNFPEPRPFEREFEGVSNFVSVSDTHVGWVTVHDVGKDEKAGFFYYAMEAADDVASGQDFDPQSYTPRTLTKLLEDNDYLSVPQCVDLGIGLAEALAALHGERFVHRDVKPSNIIFARNKPKLADIGLVASDVDGKSINGTEGYMPDDHLGTPVADVFSLGRVLYVASTGCAAARFPELPTSLDGRRDGRELMRLMDIINKACANRYEDRYQSAAEMRDDLQKLRTRLCAVGI